MLDLQFILKSRDSTHILDLQFILKINWFKCWYLEEKKLFRSGHRSMACVGGIPWSFNLVICMMKELSKLPSGSVITHSNICRGTCQIIYKFHCIFTDVCKILWINFSSWNPHRVGNMGLVIFSVTVPFDAISKQMSLPPFVFLEAIRHIRHFLIDNVFKTTLCIP